MADALTMPNDTWSMLLFFCLNMHTNTLCQNVIINMVNSNEIQYK
jgi:hypothetical protein